MGLNLQTEVLGERGTSNRWARGGNPDCQEGLASGDKKMVLTGYFCHMQVHFLGI